jgi:hypothetical protein
MIDRATIADFDNLRVARPPQDLPLRRATLASRVL